MAAHAARTLVTPSDLGRLNPRASSRRYVLEKVRAGDRPALQRGQVDALVRRVRAAARIAGWRRSIVVACA
jgi:hypothetical protein